MELNIQTLMMLFFILFLVLSIWKIWAFLPNEQLKDDDRTDESEAKLKKILDDVLNTSSEDLSEKEILKRMKMHKEFDEKLFWRFNLNRLKHLL